MGEAVAHVQCQVCYIVVSVAFNYASEAYVRDEDGIADLVDGLCTNAKKAPGEWAANFDIIKNETTGRLLIEQQQGLGYCKNECLTLKRACTLALKGKEQKMASVLFENINEEGVSASIVPS